MGEGPQTTLEDDEAALAGYAAALADAVEHVARDWMLRLIDSRAPGLGNEPHAQATAATGAAQVLAELRQVLALDISDQTVGPLEILRRAVRFPTSVLAAAAVEPVSRDEFAARNFPDDVYDLNPASFAAIDDSLHEPGLMWGAAKAHVHLRRRRQAE